MSQSGSDYAPIYRNKERIKEEHYQGYLTTRLTEEALANLATDPSETRDLAAKHPVKARELFLLHEVWLKEMILAVRPRIE